jgi:hypothetical protein
MNLTDQNIAIAKFCGWTDINFYEDNAGPGYWNGYPPPTLAIDKSGEWDVSVPKYHKKLPNYVGSLDAMSEARKFLSKSQQETYASWLYLGKNASFQDDCNNRSIYDVLDKTAGQQAEIFLKTIGKWESGD